MLEGFTLKSEGPADYGKLRGYAREQIFSQGGKPIWQLQFWVMAGAEVYGLTYSDAKENAEAARRTAKHILSGARLSVSTT